MAFAKPTPDTAATASAPQNDLCKYYSVYKNIGNALKDKELSSTEQLLWVSAAGLMSSAVNYLEKAKPIADAILKDSELLNHMDNDEMKTFKEKLEKFVNAYKDCNNVKELFELIELFPGNLEEFEEQEKNQKLSPQGKIILKLLKQYKVEDIDGELETDIKKLVVKFEEKYAEVKDDLKKDKDGVGEKIIKWHEQFSTLKDYEDQVEAFSELFEFFDLE